MLETLLSLYAGCVRGMMRVKVGRHLDDVLGPVIMADVGAACMEMGDATTVATIMLFADPLVMVGATSFSSESYVESGQ